MSKLSITKVRKNHPRFFTRLKNAGTPYGTVRNKKGFWVYYHSKTVYLYPKGRIYERYFVLRKVKAGNKLGKSRTITQNTFLEETGLKSAPKFNFDADKEYKYKSPAEYSRSQ
jgi:hypothetical protein